MSVARKTAALLLALALAAGSALPAFGEELSAPVTPPAAAAQEQPTAEAAVPDPNFLVLNYSSSRDVIRRGNKVDLTVTVKDTALLTRDFQKSDYDFSKLLDSCCRPPPPTS